MKTLFKILLSTLLFSLPAPLCLRAQTRYHCSLDSVKVRLLVDKAKEGASFGDRIVAAAKALENTPFAPAADNDSLGTIMIRLDSINQREFIYLALAAAKTAALSSPSLKDFERNLENISRKKGTDDGFASQFLYSSDWVVDNVYRGNLKEMTEYPDGATYRTKTLDFVSRHPELFPAMADPENADKIKIMEYGYRSHRIPHLKKQSIGNKIMKDLLLPGDILILCPNEPDYDIYDIGIVSFVNGEPALIHISREEGKVITDPYPLPRLFKIEGQHFYGYRWLRPLE